MSTTESPPRTGTVHLHFGSSRHRSDEPAEWNWKLAYPNSGTIAHESGELEDETKARNAVEWFALLSGLEYLANNPGAFEFASVRGGNRLVIQQAAKRWKVEDDPSRELAARCYELVERIGKDRLIFEWIPQNNRPPGLPGKYHRQKTGRQKTKLKGTAHHRVSRWHRYGIRAAAPNGFYLFEVGIEPVKWTIYDRANGQPVASYWPATGRWNGIGRIAGEKGSESNFLTFFATLRRTIQDA